MPIRYNTTYVTLQSEFKHYYIVMDCSLQTFRKQLLLNSIERATRRIHQTNSPSLQSKTSRFQLKYCQLAESGPLLRGDVNAYCKLCATSSSNTLAKIWSVQTARLKYQLKGHQGKINDIKFNPRAGNISVNGPNIGTTSTDFEIRLWTLNPDNSTQKSRPLLGHTDRVNRLAFSSEGVFLMSTSDDRTYKIFDLIKGTCLSTFRSYPNPTFSLAIHPDDSISAVSDLKGQIVLWDLRTGKRIFRYYSSRINQLLYHPIGTSLVCATDANTILNFDLRNLDKPVVIPAHTGSVTGLAFHKKQLISCSLDGSIKIWNEQEGRIQKLNDGEGSKATSLSCNDEWLMCTMLGHNFLLYQDAQSVI